MRDRLPQRVTVTWQVPRPFSCLSSHLQEYASTSSQYLPYLIKSSFKVPHEQFRKGFRTTQRNFERDFGALASSCVDLGKSFEDHEDEAAVQAAEVSIDAMIARVQALQRKVCISNLPRGYSIPLVLKAIVLDNRCAKNHHHSNAASDAGENRPSRCI